MGRKCCVLFIWEGNGKEMLSIISKGGKLEGNNVDFPFGREKGRKLTFSFPFLSGKGNPVDPCHTLHENTTKTRLLQVFTKIKEQRKGKVTVFFCGNSSLGRILKLKCDEFGFTFKKEIF